MKLRKVLTLIILSGLFLFLSTAEANSQEPPPQPVTVSTVQNLAFGVFYQGLSGGTVTIDAYGTRISGGSVVLLATGVYSVAIFDVYANSGTVISFLKPLSTLTDGSGNTMNIQIDDTNPSTPFVTTNPYSIATPVSMGGILTVGSPASNPPGNYSGTFDIIFIQE
ncbi:MAG: DUF4402 domain-containing protein [Bacteroidales bacterium]